MNAKKFLEARYVAHSFTAGALILLLLFASLPSCAPPAEEEIPPTEEVGPYEQYVSSLPEECEPVPRECFEQAKEEGELLIWDWAEWWPDEVYRNFEEEFGIKVTRDAIGASDEAVAKFSLHPETPYDVVLSAMETVTRLEDLGVVRELNHAWIPNIGRYLPERWKNVSWNKDYKWASVLDLCAMTYIWNSKFVDDPRLPSWSVLYEPDEKYGKVVMPDVMFPAVGGALKYLGYSYCSDDEGELMEAKELLLRQKPHVLAYDQWPRKLIIGEEAWISWSWTGDTWFYYLGNENLRTGLPPEGSALDGDLLVIPIGTPHPAAAHLWLNYTYRPDVLGLIESTIGFIPTNPESFKYLPEELKNWPGMAIPEEYWDKCDSYERKMFTGKGLEMRATIWEELKR